MHALLEKAFIEAAKLPSDEQEALAERILAELHAEQRWKELLDASQDLLEQWANEALAEHRAGKTIPVERKDR